MQVSVNLKPVETSNVRDPEHFNLAANPKALDRGPAVAIYPPLRSLLANLNSSESPFSTLASKIWDSHEDGPEEPFIFASRVDLMFSQEAANFGIGLHRTLAERLADLLGKEAGDALRAELQIRNAEMGSHHGYCLRISLLARAKTAEQARLRWALGLARLQQALLFAGRELRHELGASD